MVDLSDKIPYTDITLMQLIVAIIILVVGWLVIKAISRLLKRNLGRTQLPPLMIDFLRKVLSAILWVVLILIVAGALGFDTDFIILGLSGIIGLILGFGLEDTVNNFFAGAWIAFARPITMDEMVEIQGKKGKVSGVNIMSTVLITPDNQFITIPNRSVWGSPIVNFTRMPTRRTDVSVGVSYGGDVNKAIDTAMRLMRDHPLVLDSPAPAVIVTELGDSSVDLSIRAWSKTGDLWTVKCDLTKSVFEEFTRQGIDIPFPQMDVHLDPKG